MIDHYKALGLATDATPAEVKKAFRRLAKKFHPDRNAHRSQWATVEMKRLIEANRTLSDTRLREVYDRKHMQVYGRPSTERLRRYGPEKSPLATQSERILDSLLNGRARRAVAEYEQLLQSKGGFDLSDHLDLRDWVDAKFLLAEEYERAKEYLKALALYETLYHGDQARLRYSQFIYEVRDRILRICCRSLGASSPPEEAAGYLIRALSLDLTRARRAHIHKKLAEAHMDVGDEEEARRQLSIAFDLKLDLKGASKICRRLNFAPASARQHA